MAFAALLAFGCESDKVMLVDSPDSGSVTSLQDPDAGSAPDATVPQTCWRELAIVGADRDTKLFGGTVLSVGDMLFVAGQQKADGERPFTWKLFRLSLNSDNQWTIDREVTGLDLGSSGTSVQTLIEHDGRLWLATSSLGEPGEVIGLSLNLDDETDLLQPANAGGAFGQALAAVDTTLFVGDPSRNRNRGAVDAFDLNDKDISYRSTLTSSPSVSGAQFGYAVAVLDDRLIVGAPTACILPRCSETGTVHEFARRDNEWWYEVSQKAPQPNFRSFGKVVSWIGDQAWVAAPRSYHCAEECYGAEDPGTEPGEASCPAGLRPCLFVGTTTIENTPEPVELLPSDLGTNAIVNQGFGSAIASNERWLAIGAPLDASCLSDGPLSYRCGGAGAVHLYERNGVQINPARYLKPRDLRARSHFGQAVSLSEGYLVVGAPGHCGAPPGEACQGTTGAIYVFSTCPD